MKRISAEAYQALRETLAVIFWNKRPFESYVRTALRDQPELLAGLSFDEPKRIVADLLVDRMVAHEVKYQPIALNLMLEVAGLEEFPNIGSIKDREDRELRLREAQQAVKRLRKLTERYSNLVSEQEKIAAERDARRAPKGAYRPPPAATSLRAAIRSARG